eukprot:gene9231-10936_t
MPAAFCVPMQAQPLILLPVVEEVFYRGALQGALAEASNSSTCAVLTSAAWFCANHDGATQRRSRRLFAVRFLRSCVYEGSDVLGLLAAIAAHVTNNTIACADFLIAELAVLLNSDIFFLVPLSAPSQHMGDASAQGPYLQELCHLTEAAQLKAVICDDDLAEALAGALTAPSGSERLGVEGAALVVVDFTPPAHAFARRMVLRVWRSGGAVGVSSCGTTSLMEDIQMIRPSVFGAPPAFWLSLLADLGLASLHSSQPEVLVVGGAALPALPKGVLQELFQVPVHDGYASTEAGSIMVDGRACPGVEVCLCTLIPEEEDDLPRGVPKRQPCIIDAGASEGEEGEICVSSRTLCKGYYGTEVGDTPHFISIRGRRFLRTGDVGRWGSDGRLELVGRCSSTLKLAQGEFVHPEELEARLEAACLEAHQVFLWGCSSERFLVAVVVPSDADHTLEPEAEQSAVPNCQLTAPSDHAQLLPALQATCGRRGAHRQSVGEPGSMEGDRATAMQRVLAAAARRQGFKHWEVPQAVHVEPSCFAVANGLLTASGKRRRRQLVAKYRTVLEELYADLATPTILKAVPAIDNPFQEVPQLLALLLSAAPALSGAMANGGLRSLQSLPGRTFTELGIDSLAAVSFCRLVLERLGCQLPMAALLQAPSMAAVEAALASALRDTSRASSSPVLRAMDGWDATMAGHGDGQMRGRAGLGDVQPRMVLPGFGTSQPLGPKYWRRECTLDAASFMKSMEDLEGAESGGGHVQESHAHAEFGSANSAAQNGMPSHPLHRASDSSGSRTAAEGRAGVGAVLQGDLLLTGATGFLGPFLLRELRRRVTVGATVFCVVRGSTDEEAHARVKAQAEACGAWDAEWDADRAAVVVFAGDVGQPRFGLHRKTYGALAQRVRHVFHNAAHVHGVLPYAQLRSVNVEGALEALRFAALCRPKHLHHVSSCNVLRPAGAHPEVELDLEHLVAVLGDMPGYAQTKAVAELLVVQAARCLLRSTSLDSLAEHSSCKSRATSAGYCKVPSERLSSKSALEAQVELGLPLTRTARFELLSLSIYRLSTLFADSGTGYGNGSCFTAGIIRGAALLGCYPASGGGGLIPRQLLLTPVDHAAAAVAALGLDASDNMQAAHASPSIRVFHPISTHPLPWASACRSLQACGYPMRAVDDATWYLQVKELTEWNPLYVFRESLLAQAVLRSDHGMGPCNHHAIRRLQQIAHCAGASQIVPDLGGASPAPRLQQCPAVTPAHFARFIAWMAASGWLPPSKEIQDSPDPDLEASLPLVADNTGVPPAHEFYRVEGWYPALREVTFETDVWCMSPAHADLLRRLQHALKAAALAEVSAQNDISRSARPRGLQEFHLRVVDSGVAANGATGRRYEVASVNTARNQEKERVGESRRDRNRRLLRGILGQWGEHRPVDLELYNELWRYLEASIAKMGGQVFVRLSTRSPKDAIRNLQLLHPSGGLHERPSVAGVIRAVWKTLCVSSAQEAMDLLLASDRMVEDIRMCQHLDLPMKLVVRRWSEDIDPTLEFRLFVFGGKLTAGCSYHAGAFIPEVYDNSEVIASLLKGFWEENVAGAAPEGCCDYTVDVVLASLPNREVLTRRTKAKCGFRYTAEIPTVKLIEINYPPPVASTILFNWESPVDRRQLLSGPYSLRMTSQQDMANKGGVDGLIMRMLD